MLLDASVARSFAVIGWAKHLVGIGGGRLLVADGVHARAPEEPSELRAIRNALQRQADRAGYGSGLASRALAAVQGLEELLALPEDKLVVLSLAAEEFNVAVRLQSRDPQDREWRRSLGARSRRLDAGEAASIAIAATRSLAFASDDEDALAIWEGLTGSTACRTRDLLHQVVDDGLSQEEDAREMYRILQTDDLHNLGGPLW